MAFVPSLPPCFSATRARTPASSAPVTMVHAPLSRRSVLRVAAFSAVSAAAAAIAGDIDLKELKEEVEELNYEEEVTDVGPDPVEKNITRIRKKEEEPAYKIEERELVKEEKEDYQAMLKKEAEEDARIKAQFSK